MMLNFRMYEPADFGGCLDLIRKGHDPQYPEARFRWLHEESPWGPSRISLCMAEGRVVGIYSVVPKVLRWQDKQYIGGRDVDPVVDPDFRSKGLFKRLLEFGVNYFTGIDLYFNFANPVSIKGFERMGWHQVMRLPDRVYQLGFRRVCSPDFLLWSLNRLSKPPVQNVQTRELGPEELEDLISADPIPTVGTRLGVLRSPGYLRWRYLNHPVHTYRYFLANGDDKDFSLVICREVPEQGLLLVIDIAGFGVEPNLGNWLHLWSRNFPNYRVISWTSIPSNNHRGFVENPRGKKTGLPFLVRLNSNKLFPKKGLDRSNWLICRGDLELL